MARAAIFAGAAAALGCSSSQPVYGAPCLPEDGCVQRPWDAGSDVAPPEFSDAGIVDAEVPDAPDAGDSAARPDADAGGDAVSDAPADNG